MKEEEIRPRELFNDFLKLADSDLEVYFSDRTTFTPCACPACGARQATPGMEKLGFCYTLCGDCGSLYNNPRPPAAMFDRYYRESAAVKFWGNHFFKETQEARREKMFRPRARLIAEWFERLGLGDDASFTDVGSGYGIFLEEVARLGIFARVMGIEPAPNLAAICREKGFSVLEKPMEEIRSGELQVSFATAFEVLEHVHDPAAFLGAVRGILEPGGVFLFTTLTVTGFDIQALWEHSKSVYPPHHINLLSVPGMKRLAERTGFELMELATPGQLDVQIVGNCLAENPSVPLPRFVRQIVFDVSDDVRNSFQTFLRENQLSSHIRLLLRNPGRNQGH